METGALPIRPVLTQTGMKTGPNTQIVRENLLTKNAAILHDRIRIADIVNAQVITPEEAPKGYADFDKGVAVKFILDPHGTVAKAA